MKKHKSFGLKLKFVTNVDFLWVLYAVCLMRGCGFNFLVDRQSFCDVVIHK
jgi:hypothetical protein